MEAGGVQPIEPRGTVVSGMQPPQQRLFVSQAMKPIVSELGDQHGESALRHNRPGRRPQGHPEVSCQPQRRAGAGPPHGRIRESCRQRAADEQVQRIGACAPVTTIPVATIREQALQRGNRGVEDHDRRERDQHRIRFWSHPQPGSGIEAGAEGCNAADGDHQNRKQSIRAETGIRHDSKRPYSLRRPQACAR